MVELYLHSPRRLHGILLDSLSTGTDVPYVIFETLTAVTMKNGVFWDVKPCGSCKNRRFGGT
jgi:hypothetical protein